MRLVVIQYYINRAKSLTSQESGVFFNPPNLGNVEAMANSAQLCKAHKFLHFL